MTAVTKVPVVGDDGVISEGKAISTHYLPAEVGLRRQSVEYTCVDASQQFLAVGSAQGYVWVIELHSSRLLREFSDFKGTAITAIKLNPVRDYLAFGTSRGFIQVERLLKITSKKLCVQEKSGQSVSCLEWSENGEDIFCGFDLGRLVQFSVKFNEGAMNRVPLDPENYGSSLVQLSVSENLLLVSTLDRAFLLDTNTHKLDQIGRRERKSGMYGGCFSKEGQTMLVSRPGLRIWIADKSGKVLGTMAFKETLCTQRLPALVVNSVPTCPLQFSRSWQFSTLHPWLGGRFVVTFHENVIFVLDPVNGAVVGVAILQDAIRSLSISGGFLYILSNAPSKALVRVALHHAYVTMEYDVKKELKFSLYGSATNINSSQDSLESLFKGNTELPTKEPGAVNENLQLLTLDERRTPSEHDAKGQQPPTGTSTEKGMLPSDITNSPSDDSTLERPEDWPIEASCTSCEKDCVAPWDSFHKHCLGEACEIQDDLSVAKFHKSRREQGENEDSLVPDQSDPAIEEITFPSEKVDFGSKIRSEVKDLLKPTLEKVSQFLSVPNPAANVQQEVGEKEPEQYLSDEGEVESTDIAHETTDLPVDIKEQSRRLRMSQAAGDNVVAGSKSHRKRKRRIKGKKLSSATSSASVSMEDVAVVQDLQLPFEEGNNSQCSVEPPESPVVEIDNDEQGKNIGLPSINVTEENWQSDGIPSCDIDILENFVEDLNAINNETSVQQVVDNESGQQVIDNESGQQYEVFEDRLDVLEKHGTESPDEPVLAKSVSDSVANEEECSGLHEDVLDNPLYQDTDEEQVVSDNSAEVGTSRMEIKKASLNIELALHAVAQKQVTLQPAYNDPLQDEECLETGTTADRPRHTGPYPYSYRPPDIGATVKTRGAVSSWIEVDESSCSNVIDRNLEASDSSHDSELEVPGDGIVESQVVEDFYQLCGTLVKNTADQHQQDSSPPPFRSHFSQASTSGSSSLGRAQEVYEAREVEVASPSGLEEATVEARSWDIWVSVPHPTRHSLQCVCLSEVLLWVVDSRARVYCTTCSSRGRDWQHIKKAMQQVSSSASGRVVWSTYHQNAYVRLGIGMNPAGSTWKNVTKNTSLAHKVKQLAVEDSGVWAITVDNRVLFRKGVEERSPEGRVWQEVNCGTNFSFVSCCNSIVWALSSTGKVFVREGIAPSSPSGKKWAEIKSPKMIAVSLTGGGVAWGINDDGAVGFRTGVRPTKPGGHSPWWEVVINTESQAASSPLNSLWQAMSASSDGTHLLTSAVSSLVSLPHQHQVTTVSASSKAGVVVLEAGYKLHGCWKMATGYHYSIACKEGIFPLTSWSRVAAGGTALWFVSGDGDLYCLSPGNKLKRVEVPSSVELIAASPNCMWVISKDMVWSRQGMSAELPEGISFDYIELSTLLHSKKLRSVACGKKVAWGIDSSGVPHFRFGVHAREPGTGMSPAWVPVEDHLGPLLQIAVCPEDWLVWACDEEHNVYARSGVTVDFPVGRKWVKIPKEKIKELAATGDKMYGLTPNGELMCRYGISENNVQGSFWRRLPGKYQHITTGAFGELWTLDDNGQVWKQEVKAIQVSNMHKDFDASITVDPESWEFV